MLRYGRLFRAVSPAVIDGMLAGSGILILSSQFHVMVDDAPKGNGIDNLASIPAAIQKGLPLSEMGSVGNAGRCRRDLIQQFETLYENQVQLCKLATERIPATHQDANHDHATRQPKSPLLDKSQREPLAVRQQDVSDRLTALVEQLNTRGIFETVRDPIRSHC